LKNIRDKLQKEMEAVKYELSVTLPQEIKRARELGDLSENAEYQAAKERQRLLQARQGHLATRLSALSMVNLDRIPHDAVSYGSTVHLYEAETDKEIVYTLVSSEESDVKAGLISTSSPIGRSLVGKKEGDEIRIVTPGGRKEYELRKLITIHNKEKESEAEETE
jgi:transcription elongation factor GreA